MGDGGVARPLVPLFLGGVAASLAAGRWPPALWAAGGLLAVLLAGSGRAAWGPGWLLAGGRSRLAALFAAGGFLVSLLAAGSLARLPGDLPELLARPQPLDLQGVVAGPPEPVVGGWRFPLRLIAAGDGAGTWWPARGRVSLLVRVPELEGRPGEPGVLEELGLGLGDRVAVRAELRPLPSDGNPGLFSPGAWRRRQGVAAEGWLPSPRFLQRLETGTGLRAWAEGLRLRLAVRLFEGLEPELAGLGAALLLGDRRWLPPATADQVRAAGLGHLLAVSGLHVGILGGLAWWLVGGRRQEPGWLVRGVISLWLGLVGLLTGGAPSAQRAVIMALVGLWAPAGRRDPAQALAAAGLLLLLRHPLAGQDLGFQLSFAATAGVLLLGPRLGEAGRRAVGRLGLALGYGLGAGLAVAPLTAWHLGEVALWGVPATLAATPVLTAGLVGLLAVAVFGSGAPSWLVDGTEGALEALLAVARVSGGLPGARWSIPRPPGWLFLLAGGAFLWGARQGPRLLPQGLARRRVVLAAAGVALLWGWSWGRPPGLLTLTVIDVGQGDALLVETPRGRRVLIDGGGWPAFGAAPAPDVGERVILPFLRAERIGRLDLVVSTHPDGDHTLGLRAVLERMPVGLLVHNGWIGPGTAVDLLGPWRAEVDRLVWQGPGRPRALPHVALHAGDRILLEPGVSLTVLHPPREGFPRDGNDGSLVLLLEGRGVRFLLLGDAERRAQEAMLRRWGREGLASDVVKLAHHGAASGTWLPFLEAVAPQVALNSAGRANRYGHPHAETLAALQRLGVPLYRTDRDGALRVVVGRGWARVQALGRSGSP